MRVVGKGELDRMREENFNRSGAGISNGLANDSRRAFSLFSANARNGSNQSEARELHRVSRPLYSAATCNASTQTFVRLCLSVPISRNIPAGDARYNSL